MSKKYYITCRKKHDKDIYYKEIFGMSSCPDKSLKDAKESFREMFPSMRIPAFETWACSKSFYLGLTTGVYSSIDTWHIVNGKLMFQKDLLKYIKKSGAIISVKKSK